MSSATTVAGFLFAHRRLRGAAGNGEHGVGRRGPERGLRGGYPRRDTDLYPGREPAGRESAPRHERRGVSGFEQPRFDRSASETAPQEAPRTPRIYRDRLQYNREARARILHRREGADE